MQADNMYPKGWHSVKNGKYSTRDATTSKASLHTAPYITRSLAPPKYLFADFGISLALKPGEPHHRLGARGTRFPPEMGPNTVVDTYAADVWALGSLLKDVMRKFGSDYKAARTVLDPVIDLMIREDPNQRPTAQESLKKLRTIVESLGDAQLRITLQAKLIWSFYEIKTAISAILQGQGDEKVLFAKLRGREPPKTLSFVDGSIRERIELSRRVCKFLLHYGNGGNVLGYLATKQSAK